MHVKKTRINIDRNSRRWLCLLIDCGVLFCYAIRYILSSFAIRQPPGCFTLTVLLMSCGGKFSLSRVCVLTYRTTGCFDDRLLTMMTDTGFYVP